MTWDILSREAAFKNNVLTLQRERIRASGGREGDWTVVEVADGVAVLPVGDDGSIHLIKQYRHPVAEWVWELPAGRLEIGEEAEDGARRELEEEAGLRASTLDLLFTQWPLAGICRHQIHIMVARDLEPVPTRHEPFEEIENRCFTRAEVLSAMADGTFRCGILLSALARWMAEEVSSEA